MTERINNAVRLLYTFGRNETTTGKKWYRFEMPAGYRLVTASFGQPEDATNYDGITPNGFRVEATGNVIFYWQQDIASRPLEFSVLVERSDEAATHILDLASL